MTRARTIVYADDDTDDKLWVTEACKALGSMLEIRFFDNGKQVLHYLSSLNPTQFPAAVVLDLNMPELDGRQTLQRIRSNEAYRNIPIVIVTTSSNKLDQEICLRLGADLFLTKPGSHKEWQNIVRQLEPFVLEDEKA